MNILTLIPLLSDWALLAVRVVIAAIFLAHGWPKLKDLKQNAANFGMMGFKPGAFWGTIVAFVEVFGALAILAGFQVQIAGVLLAMDMFVATGWKLKQGMKLVNGVELDLLLLVVCLALVTLGAGMYSLQIFF
ncbi:MAG: DoxX family protein [Patescibacteria group bacterium]